MLAKGPCLKRFSEGRGPFPQLDSHPQCSFAPSPRLFSPRVRRSRVETFAFHFSYSSPCSFDRKRTLEAEVKRGHQKSIWLVNIVLSKIQIWFMKQNPEWHKLFSANSFCNLVVRSWTSCFYVMRTSCFCVNFYGAEAPNDRSSFQRIHFAIWFMVAN